MKTKEELNTIKEEVEAVRGKLRELTDDELAEVAGGKMDKNGVLPIIFAQTIMIMPNGTIR